MGSRWPCSGIKYQQFLKLPENINRNPPSLRPDCFPGGDHFAVLQNWVFFSASLVNTHHTSVLEKCTIGTYRFENTRKHFPDYCKVKNSVKALLDTLTLLLIGN